MALVPEEQLQCPEPRCGQVMRRKYSSQYDRYWYSCPRWPACRGSIGCHPDGRALGIPANLITRQWRQHAHMALDNFWKVGRNNKERAEMRARCYSWLARKMGLQEVHIAELDKAACQRVIEICEQAWMVGEQPGIWSIAQDEATAEAALKMKFDA